MDISSHKTFIAKGWLQKSGVSDRIVQPLLLLIRLLFCRRRYRGTIPEFLRYVFYIGWATIAELALFGVFVHILLMDPLVANPITYILGVIATYLLSVYAVFAERRLYGLRAFVVFLSTAFLGLGTSEGIIFVTLNLLDWQPLLGKAAATGVTVLVNFLLRKVLLFSSSGRAGLSTCQISSNPEAGIVTSHNGLRNIQKQVYEDYQRVAKAEPRILKRFVERRRLLLTECFPWPASGAVLDVGCGEGVFLAGLFGSRGFTRFGLDLTRMNCIVTCQRIPDARVTQGDAESLPFADNSFNIVFVNGVFHHVAGRAKMANELVRVTTSNGWIIVIEPNRFNPLYAALTLLKRHERGLLSFDAGHLVEIMKPQLLNTCVRAFNHFDFPYYHLPPRFLEAFVDLLHNKLPSGLLSTHILFVGQKAGEK